MRIATRLFILFATVAMFSGRALAHDVPPSAVMLDVGFGSIDVELQLPLNELGSALRLPLAARPDAVIVKYGDELERYVSEHFHIRDREGRAFTMHHPTLSLRQTSNANWSSNEHLVVAMHFTEPTGSQIGGFEVDDDVIAHRVVSHQILVYRRRDLRLGMLGDAPRLLGLMGFGQARLQVQESEGSWWHGFARIFSLGMHHIAEGTDHLLFLLALLLPAPLLSARGRWRGRKTAGGSARTIVKIVSGFTLGHSVTLALASTGVIAAPARAIEILIAVSILVSAVHAWRPIFAGKELWIASGFGLIHGLAFASTLSGLSFDGTTLALSLLGFNLGIEAMQLVVIAATLPILIALSASRGYTGVRLVGAAFAAACACSWIAERAFGEVNPLEPIIDALAAPPSWLLAGVCIASGFCFVRLITARTSLLGPSSNRTSGAADARFAINPPNQRLRSY